MHKLLTVLMPLAIVTLSLAVPRAASAQVRTAAPLAAERVPTRSHGPTTQSVGLGLAFTGPALVLVSGVLGLSGYLSDHPLHLGSSGGAVSGGYSGAFGGSSWALIGPGGDAVSGATAASSGTGLSGTAFGLVVASAVAGVLGLALTILGVVLANGSSPRGDHAPIDRPSARFANGPGDVGLSFALTF